MFLRWLTAICCIYNIWSFEGSTIGEVLFHKKYIDGARRTSCAECHNITEEKLHDLHLPLSDEKHRLIASQFLNQGLQHPSNECLQCHNIQKKSQHSRLKEKIKKSHFRNADASCLECHKLDEKHYFRIKKPGPALQNSFYRNEFKRGLLSSLDSAIKDCMQKFQLRESNEDAKSIVAYLKTMSVSEKNAAHDYGIVSKYLPLKVSGNNLLGKGAYELSCLPCHRRLKITLFENPLSKEGIYRKVRGMDQPRLKALQSLPQVLINEVPNPYLPKNIEREPIPLMPVYSSDRLSDSELINIANYLVERQKNRW